MKNMNPMMGMNQNMQMNPMNALMQLIGGNQQILQGVKNSPMVNAVFSQMEQSGMGTEQFARQFAKQNGIDLNPMINMLRQRGFRI